MRKLTQRAVLRLMMASAVVVALVTLALRGLTMPWSEEGLLFALYGAGVGSALTVLGSMALVWLSRPRR